MSTNQKKSSIFLTNSKYNEILEVIGLSRDPISISEILKEMGTPKDKYVYDMIELLVPLYYEPLFLFNWTKVSTIAAREKGTWSSYDTLHITGALLRLNHVFKLRWAIKGYNTDSGEYIRQNIGLEFKKAKGIEQLIISHSHNRNIIIERDLSVKEKAHLRIVNEGEEYSSSSQSQPLLITKKKGNNLYVYFEIFGGDFRPVKYLFATSKNDHKPMQQYKNELYSQHPEYDSLGIMITPDILRITELPDISNVELHHAEKTTDRTSNWKFRLNIRGLLLYILGRFGEDSNKEKKKKKKVKYNVRGLHNVLENLSQNYSGDFPFLLYYSDIKKVFDNLLRQNIPKYLQIEILKNIAFELRSLLDTASIEDLNYEVTKRYYDKIRLFFFERFSLLTSITPLIEDRGLVDLDTANKITKYQSKISEYLIFKQEKDLDEMKKRSKYYSEELEDNIAFETITKEFSNTLDKDHNHGNLTIISLDAIAKKFERLDLIYGRFSDLHKIFSSQYRDRYIVTEHYLIPNSRIEQLKSLLLPLIIDYDKARSIAIANDFPADCIPELLDKIGFIFIFLSNLNSPKFSKEFIVKRKTELRIKYTRERLRRSVYYFIFLIHLHLNLKSSINLLNSLIIRF